MSLSVAITGGIACGKSLFAEQLRQLGVAVLDADEVVHILEAPGGKAVESIRQRFGEGVIQADGGVDRKVLGSLVFADPVARAALNQILHPLVKVEIHAWLERSTARISAVVIPLLFEVGWQDGWDWILCVSSDTQTQMDRLMRFRGLSAEQARQRLDAQMPIAEKAARAHLTINNNAGAASLAQEAMRIYRFLMEKSE